MGTGQRFHLVRGWARPSGRGSCCPWSKGQELRKPHTAHGAGAGRIPTVHGQHPIPVPRSLSGIARVPCEGCAQQELPMIIQGLPVQAVMLGSCHRASGAHSSCGLGPGSGGCAAHPGSHPLPSLQERTLQPAREHRAAGSCKAPCECHSPAAGPGRGPVGRGW